MADYPSSPWRRGAPTIRYTSLRVFCEQEFGIPRNLEPLLFDEDEEDAGMAGRYLQERWKRQLRARLQRNPPLVLVGLDLGIVDDMAAISDAKPGDILDYRAMAALPESEEWRHFSAERVGVIQFHNQHCFIAVCIREKLPPPADRTAELLAQASGRPIPRPSEVPPPAPRADDALEPASAASPHSGIDLATDLAAAKSVSEKIRAAFRHAPTAIRHGTREILFAWIRDAIPGAWVDKDKNEAVRGYGRKGMEQALAGRLDDRRPGRRPK